MEEYEAKLRSLQKALSSKARTILVLRRKLYSSRSEIVRLKQKLDEKGNLLNDAKFRERELTIELDMVKNELQESNERCEYYKKQ